MTRTLILQSFPDLGVPCWVERCRASVRSWAQQQNYAYEFMGDELFAKLPDDYRRKVADKKPVAADLARLLWIAQCLQEDRADVVAWLDADIFIFAPANLQVNVPQSCVFGREYWLQARPQGGGFQVRKNVHNAYCAFRQGCPILPFLIHVTQQLVRRVDPEFLAPQFVGPKLLSSLHNIVGFELDDHFGAISPVMAGALVDQNQRLLSQVRGALSAPICAANLCHSLHQQQGPLMETLMDELTGFEKGWV
ncbi:MAG: hypothetical protein HN856_04905 [Gammaproteobacteria bacterium]|nr:hypothetical protein [Gammaproteobacteria bacterium]